MVRVLCIQIYFRYQFRMESIHIRTATARAVTASAERRPLHEEVIDQLRDMIVQGGLAPETKLNERVLAAQLGISRTPLREAIKYLASEGLVAVSYTHLTLPTN